MHGPHGQPKEMLPQLITQSSGDPRIITDKAEINQAALISAYH
jgi:transposase-like protein